MVEFGFEQSVRKLPQIEEKDLFYEIYFKEINIHWNPLIWFQDKMITKFGQSKWVRLVLGKVYENRPKIKKKSYFTKLILKRVISIGNHLFGPKIR